MGSAQCCPADAYDLASAQAVIAEVERLPSINLRHGGLPGFSGSLGIRATTSNPIGSDMSEQTTVSFSDLGGAVSARASMSLSMSELGQAVVHKPSNTVVGYGEWHIVVQDKRVDPRRVGFFADSSPDDFFAELPPPSPQDEAEHGAQGREPMSFDEVLTDQVGPSAEGICEEDIACSSPSRLLPDEVGDCPSDAGAPPAAEPDWDYQPVASEWCMPQDATSSSPTDWKAEMPLLVDSKPLETRPSGEARPGRERAQTDNRSSFDIEVELVDANEDTHKPEILKQLLVRGGVGRVGTPRGPAGETIPLTPRLG